MKAATATVLVLAVLVVAAAAMGPPDAVDRHHSRGDYQLPLTGLTKCLTACYAATNTCLIKCESPLVRGDPAGLSYCVLSCTNDGLVCSTGCASQIIGADHHPAADWIAAGTLRGGGHHHNDDGHSSSDDQTTPLTKLALCVSTCGSDVANCIMTKCYEPLAKGKGNPVMVPLCLLGCTTDVMTCASSCPNNIAN